MHSLAANYANVMDTQGFLQDGHLRGSVAVCSIQVGSKGSVSLVRTGLCQSPTHCKIRGSLPG